MELLDPFPDVEDALLAMLEVEASTCVSRPNDLPDELIQVRRIGGVGDRITDAPRAEVSCFVRNDYNRARDLALACQQRILASPGTAPAGSCIDLAETDSGPHTVVYGDPTITRFVATYRLEFRR